jgi:uncharacterized phage-associated protein
MTMNTVHCSVFDVANWFLTKARDAHMNLRPLKLQKLVYFAYGWYYAYFDKPLFPETIYAWRHGPVVADLWRKFKVYGGKPITAFAETPVFDENTTWILEQVFKHYSLLADTHLSRITHRFNAPWSRVYSPDNQHVVIPPEIIYGYFKNLVEKYDNAPT